mmetsp:Transcript_2355/g.2598  ORF Transcript_2355/g.2598 Transcript_2355/m.2598 type:complete len:220 (+) Transcript_2355:3555-4214(+)
MSDLFSTYESDLQLALQEAKSKLAQVSSADGNERKQFLRAIETATDECLEVLDQMSIEVQNLPSNQRSIYNTKIRQYKSQVEDSKGRLKKLLDDQDKYELFGNRYTDDDSHDDMHDSQRKQLLNNNASLERTSERLRDSQRIALETENIGGNILNDLRSQREQIMGSRNTLMTADGYVDKSMKTLKSMSRRLTANKFISYSIIAVLILLIFLVLASKFW